MASLVKTLCRWYSKRLIPGPPELRRALLQVGSVPDLDASLAQAMAARTDVRWGMEHGEWVLGTGTPRKTLLR